MSTSVSRRRAGWTVLDQAASSLTNFGLSFVILRSTGLIEFGAFTIGYLAYQLALNLGRALVSEPLLIRFSASETADTTNAAATATGVILILGVVAGALLCGVAALFGSPTRQALIVMGIALPFLMLQDGVRYAFFALGSPRRAFWNDSAWGLLMVLLLVLAFGTGYDSLTHLMAAWGIAGSIASGIGLGQLRQSPRFIRTGDWFREHADLGRRYVIEYLVGHGVGSAALFAVGAIAGLSALGAINGSRVLFGPLNVLYAGIMAFAVPEGVRLVKRSPARLNPTIRQLGLFLIAPALILGAALYLLPANAGEILVRNSDWSRIQQLIVPTSLIVGTQGFNQSRRAGLRILADARRSMWAQVLSSPLAFFGAVVGAFIAGSVGAAWGMAIAGLGTSVVWSHLFASSRDAVM